MQGERLARQYMPVTVSIRPEVATGRRQSWGHFGGPLLAEPRGGYLALASCKSAGTLRPMHWVHRTLFILLTCTAVVAVALYSFARWQASSESRLEAHFASQIAALDEGAAAAFVETLRRHDRLALVALVDALADPRPQVALAAQESIGSLVTDWRRLPASAALPRLTALADHLADRYPRYPAQGQQFCRQMAGQMLLWQLDDADFPTDELVVHCERILAARGPQTADATEGLPERKSASLGPTLPPIVSADVARRERPPAAKGDEATIPLTPTPVLQAPLLAPIDPDPNLPLRTRQPAASAGDTRPIEPRQFIQPRVPPIPRPDEE